VSREASGPRQTTNPGWAIGGEQSHSFDPGMPIEAVQTIGARNSTGPVVPVTVYLDKWNDDASGAGSVAHQQRHLHDATRAVPRGHPQYARRVIFAWHARLGIGPPFVVNEGETATPDATQTEFCQDCSTGSVPVEAEFCWMGWGSLCSVCSLRRFDTAGKNRQAIDRAEQRRTGRSSSRGSD
jgi:hypothetical protein